MPPQEKESTPSSPSCGRSHETHDHSLSKTYTQPPSTRSKAWTHLNENVRASGLAELELLILTFCIGLQDAVSFPDFHCFASNQTGNTVFLMLAIVLPEADGDMFHTANIGIALGFFLAAAWLTGQLGHVVGARRRCWLVLCNLLQTGLVFAAAALQYAHQLPTATSGSGSESGSSLALDGGRSPSTLWAIGLLAFAAGSQVVQARSLRMTEITTAMATAAWVDLMIDPDLLVWRNRGRNRRVGFLGALVLGSLAGAFIFRRVGSPAALVVSGAGKLLVTGMYLFNPADRPPKVEESAEDSA
ncbi:hypothetical protein C8A01DRAFT_32196 [Parachaetomium inaequale]|uniref:DUF1275 domain protein n=1 Tax=Parachaetomium inaequale TaxID=2588326 RepID=A0AAN6SUK2_9PEZI|nr:hypothetical protein C8A01DRAFT_32196 [Parachaetomium inaequale]